MTGTRAIALALALLLCACAAQTQGTSPAESDGGRTVTYFRYTRSGSMVPRTYEAVLQGGEYFLAEDGDPVRPFSPQCAEELLRVVEEYGLASWDGFHGSDPNVLDGEGFSLEVSFSDGTHVYASGDNSFPDGYYRAAGAIVDVFEREEMSRAAGAYTWEGDGENSPLTFTLEADGDCSLSGGQPGSELRGSWGLFYGAVYAQLEDGEALVFLFGDGSLTFAASASDGADSFPFPDGALLLRPDGEGTA